MESEDFNIVQLELKYCERCGGLWVRRMGGEEIYCPSCAVEMVDFAPSSRRRTSADLPVNHKSEQTAAPKIIFICGEGGNA
jgi:Zn-finger nucleic acid-binding protein